MTLMLLAMSARSSISRRSRGARVRFGVFSLQKRQHLFHERVRRNAMLFSKDRDRAMLDELVGPANANNRRIDHLRMQMLHYGASETIVQNMILDRANDVHAAREEFQRAGIERLDPARVDERDGNAFFFQLAGRLLRHFKHISQAENGHFATVLHDLGLADLEELGGLLRNGARAWSAGVTDGDGPGIVVGDRPEHVDKFIFILGLHVNEVRDVPQVADIEKPVMRRTIVSALPRAIHAESDVQILERDIVNDHVVSALHEGRVNRQKWLQTL